MLVPIKATASAAQPHHTFHRRNIAFIAHLIATAEQDPQTRTVRRASAVDAMSVYGMAGPVCTGKTLSKIA